MRFKNSTDFPDHFLRRMVSWCCKQLDLPVRWVHRGTFRNSRRSISGHAGRHEFTCCIGPDSAFPSREWRRGGVLVPAFASRIDALVELALHELQHCNQSYLRHKPLTNFRLGHVTIDLPDVSRDIETDAQFAALHGYRAFMANREALLAEWNLPVERKTRQFVSVIERRAIKAANDLDRWNRKLKLAQTKIRKLKARVRYYERKQAACSGKGGAP